MTDERGTFKALWPKKRLLSHQSADIYQLFNVKKYHKRQLAVDIESLTISPASITGLIGPNGSGKSSLLRLLAFVDGPSEGRILFNGRKAAPFDASVRFHVSLLPQEPYLLKRSVFDNIAYGLVLRGVNQSRHTEAVTDALSLVGLSAEEFAGRSWYQLSGGEAQRVALAARLVLKPNVLLLDEPTASVDAASAQQIKASALKACREWGTTLIVASHDWQWVHEICHSVIPMFNGRVMENGTGNILFGPWRSGSEGCWERPIEDGQTIRVSEPPSTAAVAVIPQDSIFLSLDKPLLKPHEHFLQGVLTLLALDPSTGSIQVTLRIADLSFSLQIPTSYAQKMLLFPGQKVYITYPVSAVVWY
ncbi:MAG: ABC transporter ATP-binding protein [Deltaproteobacteria bacterium]|nr:ABC transporter ATP-binding protein [Deltaproteobacteria bacterium]